jgi:hypothetical protein
MRPASSDPLPLVHPGSVGRPSGDGRHLRPVRPNPVAWLQSPGLSSFRHHKSTPPPDPPATT